jgi:K+/H+ antiporter YhaU regulatory subunit KhtT
MEQVRIQEGSALVGRTIVDAGIRQYLRRHHRGDSAGGWIHGIQPSPDVTIQAGDEMVVLGRPQSVKALGERVAA